MAMEAYMRSGYVCDAVVLEQTISVRNELGLHARPAAQIAQTAQKYAATVKITLAEREIDAKSILDILSLAAPRGTDLSIKAQGDDAREAMTSIVRLFEDRFGEDR
jgi:phosphocarrier protein